MRWLLQKGCIEYVVIVTNTKTTAVETFYVEGIFSTNNYLSTDTIIRHVFWRLFIIITIIHHEACWLPFLTNMLVCMMFVKEAILERKAKNSAKICVRRERFCNP